MNIQAKIVGSELENVLIPKNLTEKRMTNEENNTDTEEWCCFKCVIS